MGTLDKQNALASLRKWTLIQDNSGPYRVYRDEKNNVYSSVTHILKETAPQEAKDALEKWIKRPDSELERDIACERGRLSHSHAEYILKLASKFARQSANKRNIWRTGSDGLERCPKKSHAMEPFKGSRISPQSCLVSQWLRQRLTVFHIGTCNRHSCSRVQCI